MWALRAPRAPRARPHCFSSAPAWAATAAPRLGPPADASGCPGGPGSTCPQGSVMIRRSGDKGDDDDDDVDDDDDDDDDDGDDGLFC